MRGWYKIWRDRWQSVFGHTGEKAARSDEDRNRRDDGAMLSIVGKNGGEDMVPVVVRNGDEDKVMSIVGRNDDKDAMILAVRNSSDEDGTQAEVRHIHEVDAMQAGPSEIRETWSETATAVIGYNRRATEHRLRVAEDEYMQAVERCNKALADWRIALHKLDWVSEPDQIDYAIYSVIAAEKHYTTTLKETKRLYRQLDDLRKQRFA